MLQKLGLLLAQKLGFSMRQKLIFQILKNWIFQCRKKWVFNAAKVNLWFFNLIKNELCNATKIGFLISQKWVLMSQQMSFQWPIKMGLNVKKIILIISQKSAFFMSQNLGVFWCRNKWVFIVAKSEIFNVAKNCLLISQKMRFFNVAKR